MVSVPRKVFLCGSRLDVNCDRPPSSKIIIYEWKRVQEAPSIVEYKLKCRWGGQPHYHHQDRSHQYCEYSNYICHPFLGRFISCLLRLLRGEKCQSWKVPHWQWNSVLGVEAQQNISPSSSWLLLLCYTVWPRREKVRGEWLNNWEHVPRVIS